MLKGLIIGADGVMPGFIFKYPKKFPNITKLAESGIAVKHAGQVIRTTNSIYYSESNWATIYTGLEAWEHNITIADGVRLFPTMDNYDSLKPFWKVLNDNGLSVGLWAAFGCRNPVDIYGYAVSVNFESIEDERENREIQFVLQTAPKDRHILERITGGVPSKKYPQTLAQRGLDFEYLKQNPNEALKAVKDYCYEDGIAGFKKELDFFYKAITDTQAYCPVDVLYFFTLATDTLGHFIPHRENEEPLIEAYQILDDFIGRLIDKLKPEITIIMSDHGQDYYNEMVQADDPLLAREAFDSRDRAIWLPNNNIVLKGDNGALLFTTHSLYGLFVAAGEGIGGGSDGEMRIIDIYPTLLEAFGCQVPQGVPGYVQPIFNRSLYNDDKLYPVNHSRKKAAVFECPTVFMTTNLINEIYIRNRFDDITVVGKPKFTEIYLNNPRVQGFIAEDKYDSGHFDEVYEGKFDADGRLIGFNRRK